MRLAQEQEIAVLYPEFEVGAMPPFGMMHGHRVFVERCFVGEPELVFNAGHAHRLALHALQRLRRHRPSDGRDVRCAARQAPRGFSSQLE